MKLTFEQLKAISFGAVDVFQDSNDYFCMHRMTDTQVAAYGARNPVHAQRAQKTAGCRLDFWTDSSHLMLHTGAAGLYEIQVNGLCAATIQADSRCTLELPKGENRVTVLLPEHAVGALRFVHLDEGASLRPHSYDRKFLFLGDSITQGWESSRPSTGYVNQVSAFFNAQVLNWAVGGSSFDENTVIPTDYDPDVVFMAYGTNDYVHWLSREEFTSVCDGYMQRVKALFPDKPVYCITPIWRADGLLVRPTGTHAQVCAYIAQRAADMGFVTIDGYTLVPHLADYMSDGFLHPNDLGFAVYAQNLIKELITRL